VNSGSKHSKYDVVIVGGGHNGLVAATYLAKAGVSTLLLERLPNTGGAVVSAQAFYGHEARLSRYSYLVSLMPEQIIKDLALELDLRSRAVASYTPVVRKGKPTGLLVERPEGKLTKESFRKLTGSDEEYDAWQAFYGQVQKLAQAIEPTLLAPLKTAREFKAQADPEIWNAIVDQPLGKVIEERFKDDTVRGVIATDALIGTFAAMNDASLVQNICFLYHLIGGGTGDWRVPVGGMGAVTDALDSAARSAGAEIITDAGVSSINADGTAAEVTWHDGHTSHTVQADWVLANVAPWVLQLLLGEEPPEKPEGSQLKINFLLERLPALRRRSPSPARFTWPRTTASCRRRTNRQPMARSLPCRRASCTATRSPTPRSSDPTSSRRECTR